MPHMSGITQPGSRYLAQNAFVCVWDKQKSTSVRFVVLSSLCCQHSQVQREEGEREEESERKTTAAPHSCPGPVGFLSLSQLRSSSDRCSEGLGLPA